MSSFIGRLMQTPYLENGQTWAGLDCWGLVEMWYKYHFFITLPEREGFYSSPDGFSQGHAAYSQKNWTPLDVPQNHCLVVMRSEGLKAGHVGVYFEGSVVHISRGHGCLCEPYKRVKRHVTGLLAYAR